MARNSKGIERIYGTLHGRIGRFVLYRLVMPLANHSFVQTEQMKQDIVAYGVPEHKMTSVPMGVPDRIFALAQADKPKIVSGQIVYVGTLVSMRRLHVLIEAFAEVHARIPHSSLVIVGEGNWLWERESLEQLAQELGLENAIHFTGFLPIERAWKLAATAQCCISPIYPSPVLNAGSPTKLIEYMALGRPVVCNDHPDQLKIIKESGAGLCVGWGVKEFSEAMVWMLDNPEKAEKMGARGPAWVAANRTYPILAEHIFKQYQTILRGAI